MEQPAGAIVPVRRRQGIGLTALIDVVFILLMFFMLTSSFIQHRTVQLSAARGSTQAVDVSRPVLLVLDEAGVLHRPAQLSVAVTPESVAAEAGEEVAVIVLPQPQVSLQQIVSSLESLRAAGVQIVSLGDVFPGVTDAGRAR